MQRRRAGFAGWLAVILISVSAVVVAQVPIDWESTAPMSLPRHSGAVIAVDGLIYALGGIEYGNTFSIMGQTYDVTSGTLFEVYDPTTDTWTRLADLPYPIDLLRRLAEGRQWPAAAAHAGKIYVFGGANLYGDVRDTIDVYDIATDTWDAGIARLPQPVCGASAATFGDMIYVFGGATTADPYASYDYVATCYAFDPGTYQLSEIAAMPSARFKTSATTTEGGILVLGGISAVASANAQIYEPASDTWTSLEPVYWERRFWGGAEIDGALFLVGGRDEHALSSGVVDAYVPFLDAWIPGDPMPTAREDAFTIALDGALYVFGGRTHDDDVFAVGERGTPRLDEATLPSEETLADAGIVWHEGTPMTTPRHFGATVTLDDRIYTIGGLEAAVPTGTVVEVYDPAADTWSSRASLPEGRFNLPAAVFDGIIYTFGGADIDGHVTDTIYAYDPASDSWSLAGHLPDPVAGMSAVTYGDRIYLFGGSHSSQMFVPKENYFDAAYAYDPVTGTFEHLPPMLVARNMAHAAVIDDEIFVIGGMKSPGATACQRYNIPTRTWTIQAEMPVPRGGSVGVTFVFGNTTAIFMIGGANRVDMSVYNVQRNEWVQTYSFGVPRNMTFTSIAAASPEKIYVIGGLDGNGDVVDTVFIGERVE